LDLVRGHQLNRTTKIEKHWVLLGPGMSSGKVCV